ncbi:glycoside hydrolase family 125 protein [Listeria sp. SHR_NRA_18]|uniref:glycoside hydrolase family 125 protein n=1 Tax=Listeria sp. SHR_NRA_18 TaxID=2269046 RepID=UPI00051D4190|nr:glycoside hydrolase family 125 protein [Listeria sp. SHR_NRA_18]KGL42132.1 glycosyl hydrolase [Listeriaceae bacterium FSL A5-0209]RQW67651.1 glycoside hydrolase family 125 protein [Listeria sp. SHR_NRA_18]
MTTKNVPKSFQKMINRVAEVFPEHEKLQEMFQQCFLNTYATTLTETKEGLPFVITGDIPAMWLRDSTSQIRPYLMVAEDDPEMAAVIAGLVKQQMRFVQLDPYANAFNQEANGKGFQTDKTEMSPHVWERKYEIDSLCYPIQLGYLLWQSTGSLAHFDADFRRGVAAILAVWKTEQHHETESPYSFERADVRQSDTLNRDGKGTEVAYTGMTWSGFRPSDDACLFGYLVPSNMFAVVALGYLEEINEACWKDANLAKEIATLKSEIEQGIQDFAVQEHPYYGEMYAYEVDGTGRKNFMDDANVPSLLAAPYLGFGDFTDPKYLATRHFILSRENPFYVEGSQLTGIGSPHTPDHYVWPIALSVQGMTATNLSEKLAILEMLTTTDGGTGFMHEGVNASDHNEYTREWFAWSNAMFSEFVLSLCGICVKGSPLAKNTK